MQRIWIAPANTLPSAPTHDHTAWQLSPAWQLLGEAPDIQLTHEPRFIETNTIVIRAPIQIGSTFTVRTGIVRRFRPDPDAPHAVLFVEVADENGIAQCLYMGYAVIVPNLDETDPHTLWTTESGESHVLWGLIKPPALSDKKGNQ